MNQVLTPLDWLIGIATLLALTILVVLGNTSSNAAGWFWPLNDAQKAKYAPQVTHFFAASEHWGMWALYPLNVLLAGAVMFTWRQWNLPTFQILLIVMLIASIFMMQGWADGDNDPTKRVLSAFSRDGLLTVPGVLLAISGGFACTITVMYFLTSRTADQDALALVFAIALTIYLFVGLLQPPYHVWGKIHAAAVQQTGSGTFAVWALYFAHKFGYVVPA